MADSQTIDVPINDWSDLGVGPIDVSVLSDASVRFAYSTSKPSVTADVGRVVRGGTSDTLDTAQKVWACAVRSLATISYATSAIGKSSPAAPADNRGSFSLNATITSGVGSFFDIPLTGQGIVSLNFSGFAGGTVVTYLATNKEGATPTGSISSINASEGSRSPTRTVDGDTRIPVAGRATLRLQVTTAGTGTINGTYSISGSSVAGIVDLASPMPAGVDEVDRSGTTSGTANTFTATTAAVNNSRQYLRVSNKASSGILYVWSKTVGTPTVDNTLAIPAGQAFVWDTKVPKGAIQVAHSGVSQKYELAEG